MSTYQASAAPVVVGPSIRIAGFFHPACAVSTCDQYAACWFSMPFGMLALCDRHRTQFFTLGVVAEEE